MQKSTHTHTHTYLDTNRYQIFLQSPDGPVDIYVVSMNADEAQEAYDHSVEQDEEQAGEEEAVSAIYI
jgi:hypothetical protein